MAGDSPEVADEDEPDVDEPDELGDRDRRDCRDFFFVDLLEDRLPDLLEDLLEDFLEEPRRSESDDEDDEDSRRCLTPR